jgi:hypothetical protein
VQSKNDLKKIRDLSIECLQLSTTRKGKPEQGRTLGRKQHNAREAATLRNPLGKLQSQQENNTWRKSPVTASSDEILLHPFI